MKHSTSTTGRTYECRELTCGTLSRLICGGPLSKRSKADTRDQESLSAIVRQHQVVGPLIVRELMADIQAMNIQQEPGENIANMAAKIYWICKRISGMVRMNEIPPDLPEICARVFLNTKTTNCLVLNEVLHVF